MERYTEDITLDLLEISLNKDENSLKKIKVFAQELPKIYRGKIPSKSGKSMNAKPEFVIEQDNFKGKLIVVECKAEISKHEKAKEEVKHYIKNMNKITPEVKLFGLAVSGQDKRNLEFTFMEFENNEFNTINADRILSLDEINDNFFKEKTKIMKEDELIHLMKNINEKLHKMGVGTKERSVLISVVLSALQITEFRRSYFYMEKIDSLKSHLINSMRQFYMEQELSQDKIKEMLSIAKIIINKLKNENLEDFKEVVRLLHDSPILIKSYQRSKEGIDLLGKFFNTSLRYGTIDGSGLGQVLTPDHIAELFVDLTNDGRGLSVNNQVVDITCGTGAFLVQSLTKLLSLARTPKQREKIREFGIWGNEREQDLVHLAILNNIMHGDGKSNVRQGDALKPGMKEWFLERGAKITHALINPPYYLKNSIPPELEFAYRAADIVKPGGEVIMIAPVAVLLGNKYRDERRKMMNSNTLKATFIMPRELFHGYASVETAISIWEVGRPHNKNNKVFAADFSDDGFIKVKYRGRQDKNGKWNEIKENWLEMYRDKKVIKGKSALINVDHNDNWTLFPYVEVDWDSVTEEDFKRKVRDFIAFKIKNGDLNEI